MPPADMRLHPHCAARPSHACTQAAPRACCVPAHPACSDRPACENIEGGGRPQDAHYPLIGALVHCNLRLGPVALQRLGHYVEHAIRRWAASTGRYEVLQQGSPAALPTEGASLERPRARQRKGVGRRIGVGSGADSSVQPAA